MKKQFTNIKLYYIIFIFLFSALTFTGCATTPLVTYPRPTQNIPGVYHRIEKGQTLWRISKIYDVDLQDLVRLNRISDATNIEIGQLIFIPYAKTKHTAVNIIQDDFIWPLRGEVICGFGQNYSNMSNRGINIKPIRNKEILSSRKGKVIFYSPNFQGYGKTIIIDHGDGFMTIYARNSDVLVKPGDSVEKGAVIARAGSAGRDKNTYLHFEVRKNHIAQNPYFYLPH